MLRPVAASGFGMGMLRPNAGSRFGIRIIKFWFDSWGWAKHSDTEIRVFPMRYSPGMLRPYAGWQTDHSIVVCDRRYLAKSSGNLLN